MLAHHYVFKDMHIYKKHVFNQTICQTNNIFNQTTRFRTCVERVCTVVHYHVIQEALREDFVRPGGGAGRREGGGGRAMNNKTQTHI